MLNRFPGSCDGCGSRVAENAGQALKLGGRWVVRCQRCATATSQPGIAAPASTERRLTADGRLLMPFDRDALPVIKGCPGARWDGEAKVWRVSLAPADRTRLLEQADRLGLEVDASLREVRHAPEVEATLERAKSLVSVHGKRPFPFQLAGIEWLATHARALLGDDMGLGKTIQVLVALPPQARVVVIAPAAVRYNWRDEAAEWRPDFRVTVLSGRASFRWPEPGEIVITSFEILPAWAQEKEIAAEHREAGASVVLVVDEAHRAKNFRSQRAKRVRGLASVCARVWPLTGTPLVNRPFDLYGVLASHGLDRDVFGGWAGFIRCFGGSKNRWGGWDFGTPTADVPERMRRVMVRRRREEVLPDLPAKTYSTRSCNGISAADRQILDDAWECWCDSSSADEPDELPDFADFSRVRALLAASRIPALLDIVEDYEEQDVPLLVFSAHRSPVDELGKREGWATITGDTPPEQRTEIQRRFQGGDFRGIAATIQAAGVGLTLTRASRALFVDRAWTPAENSQAEDRICRIGQEAQKVEIIRLVSDHPLDRHVLALLDQKEAVIDAAIERVVTYEPPPVLADAEPTEEWAARRAEWQARREADHREDLQRQARSRMAGDRWLERARARAKRPERPLTPEIRQALVAAHGYLLDLCDGAETRDGQGYSKSDVGWSRWVSVVGMDDDEAARIAERILSRYHRQLHERFPILFGEDQ